MSNSSGLSLAVSQRVHASGVRRPELDSLQICSHSKTSVLVRKAESQTTGDGRFSSQLIIHLTMHLRLSLPGHRLGQSLRLVMLRVCRNPYKVGHNSTKQPVPPIRPLPLPHRRFILPTCQSTFAMRSVSTPSSTIHPDQSLDSSCFIGEKVSFCPRQIGVPPSCRCWSIIFWLFFRLLLVI